MPRYEDDEDDDRPRSRRRRDRDDDDEDDRPSRRNRRRDEDDDEYEERPSRRSRRREEDDEVDDRPRRGSRRRQTGENPAAGISLTLGLLSILLNVLTGIPAIVFGIIGLKNSNRAGTGRELAIAGIGSAVVCTAISCVGIYFLWNMRSGRQGEERVFNNAKMIGLAFHNSHDAFGNLMPAYTTRPGQFFGQNPVPMDQRFTSWRTAALPFLDQDNLFRQYDSNQSWNSARNQMVTATHVPTYSDGVDKANQTRFRVFTGPKTPFKHGQPPPKLSGFIDGTSNTALMAESAELGPWGEPKDMEVQQFGPMPALGNPDSPFAIIVMADGSVRRVRKTIDERTLRLMVDPADGQVVPQDW
jgi:Protein of unknown function (DUF1559)